MISKKVTIKQINGLHLKPAGVLCNLTNKFNSSIILKTENKKVGCKSILSILGARIQYADEVEIICNGPDEEQAMKELVELFETPFGEE